jgi:hypothetical protein
MLVDIVGGTSWSTPVLVRIGHGSSEKVEGPAAALHFLKSRWPYERGAHYVRAIELCRTASKGSIPIEVAKEAFISAAIEANVYAH